MRRCFRLQGEVVSLLFLEAQPNDERNGSYARTVISRVSLAQVVAQFPQESLEKCGGQESGVAAVLRDRRSRLYGWNHDRAGCKHRLMSAALDSWGAGS
jgi:hypothetical protein